VTMTPDPSVVHALSRLASLTYEVPDVAETSAWFADGLCLDVRPHVSGEMLVTTEGDYGRGIPPRVLSLRQGDGPTAQLVKVRFDAHSPAASEAVQRKLQATGVATVTAPANDLDGNGFSFIDMNGLAVEVRLPLPGLDRLLPLSGIRPRRLGHVNIKVPGPAATAAWYIEHLGLKLSERLGDQFLFLRLGTEHHNLAFRGTNSNVNAHHVAMEIHGFESYRPILDRLAAAGYGAEYGPGRHAPGRNFFTYVRDPSSNLRVELFCDMAHIHDEEAYAPRTWRVEDRPHTVNIWGPQPPPTFFE
jgi:catechol 2,3-dioxygenase-like lactoylglutathione lyase family enzyme